VSLHSVCLTVRHPWLVVLLAHEVIKVDAAKGVCQAGHIHNTHRAGGGGGADGTDGGGGGGAGRGLQDVERRWAGEHMKAGRILSRHMRTWGRQAWSAGAADMRCSAGCDLMLCWLM
jgi:hypothetical protein